MNWLHSFIQDPRAATNQDCSISAGFLTLVKVACLIVLIPCRKRLLPLQSRIQKLIQKALSMQNQCSEAPIAEPMLILIFSIILVRIQTFISNEGGSEADQSTDNLKSTLALIATTSFEACNLWIATRATDVSHTQLIEVKIFETVALISSKVLFRLKFFQTLLFVAWFAQSKIRIQE